MGQIKTGQSLYPNTSSLSFLSFLLSVCLLLSLTVCTRIARAADQQIRNVLVLHSYHQGLKWTDYTSQGIIEEFESFEGEIELHFEYLDTKRIPGEEYYRQLIQFEKYKNELSNIDFEVILACDNNALRFIVENGDMLYPGVPVVFCGINNFQPGILGGKENITGVVETIDYRSTFRLMASLHPERENILVILDKTPTGQAIKREFDIVAQTFSDRFNIEYYQDFILSEVPGRISRLGGNDLIYLLTFNRDREGTFISYADGIKMIQKASKVPIYGSWDFYFGQGIIGGMLTSGHSQGKQAAIIAKEILNGAKVKEIPFVTRSINQYMFDFRQLHQFHISESDLPKPNVIINRPPGFLDRYKKAFAVALGLISILVLIMTWRLYINKKRQKDLIEINIELDRRVAEQTKDLEQKNTELEREIQERIQIEKMLVEKKDHLESALAKVKTLSGLLPICSSCKKIRDDKGYWNQIENYINKHSDATFSHGICPSCASQLYPELYEDEDPEDVQ